MSLEALEAHVSALEALVFAEPPVVPAPALLPADAIDPALAAVMADPLLAGACAARRVPADYYERALDGVPDLAYRRGCVGARSVDQLCKCVLFEARDAPDPLRRFVCVVVQYIDRISSQKLIDVCGRVLGRRVADVSLAREEDAAGLSGSAYNGMTPALLRPRAGYERFAVALVLSRRIAALPERFFWLGGGEVDVKFGVTTAAFVARFRPVISDVSE